MSAIVFNIDNDVKNLKKKGWVKIGKNENITFDVLLEKKIKENNSFPVYRTVNRFIGYCFPFDLVEDLEGKINVVDGKYRAEITSFDQELITFLKDFRFELTVRLNYFKELEICFFFEYDPIAFYESLI